MHSSTGSTSLRASSGSRSASSSMEPLRSANSTVTCLRSPSRVALEVRIFLGKVLGSIALGGAEPGTGCGGFWGERSRGGALGTELCCLRQRSTGLGARTPERRCAFLAEFRALLIFLAALRALHQRPQDEPEWFVSVAPHVIGNKTMSAFRITSRRVPTSVVGQTETFIAP